MPNTKSYLERFVGGAVNEGYTIARAPNKVVAQLLDEWRFSYDAADEGTRNGSQRTDCHDASWKKVRTYSATLLQQGVPEQQTIMWYRAHFTIPKRAEHLALWFGEVDGDSTVYVNGEEVCTSAKRRRPFAVDVTRAIRVGDNVVAVRVDHHETTELYLGGIIRPVFLVETAAAVKPIETKPESTPASTKATNRRSGRR